MARPITCDIAVAKRTFEEFDVDQSAEDVIAAMIDLSDANDTRIERPPVVFWSREGRVFGRDFRMVGWKTSDGEWKDIIELHPMS